MSDLINTDHYVVHAPGTDIQLSDPYIKDQSLMKF